MEIPEDWTFKADSVAAGFDSHVREQLPWYEVVTRLVAHFARSYIPQGGMVYDIGASTGNVGRALAGILESRNAKLIAIDNSPSMKPRYDAPGELVVANVEDYAFEPFDVAICMLSLMFVPVAKRAGLLRTLTDRLRPGGAILVVDKIEPFAGYFGSTCSRAAMSGKLESGATPEDIIKKELSLSGVQRPLRRSEIPEQAREFFRFGDFYGFAIEG